jgi:hypothetical protein
VNAPGIAVSLPTLTFGVESAAAVRFAAAPTVALAIRIHSDEPVRSLALNAQIRIAATARAYDGGEEERLVELFGTRDRWGETLRGFLWTNTSIVVPQFEGTTLAELHVSCTYDFEVAAAKYLHALGDGEVPLELLFSGTVFFAGAGGLLRTAQIPWDAEASHRLPVRVWRDAMDQHFPGSAWVRLRRDAFDRLVAYKAERSLPTWESVVDELLRERG